jgi:NADPH2:quinone reductase
MRAVHIEAHGGPEVLVSAERPTPLPGPGQVLVRVETVGVNYADVQRRKGTYAEPTALPHALGSEVAGTIAAIGDQVAGLRVGDRVMALPWLGGYAEYALASADTVLPLPDGVSFDEGAAFPLGALCAHHVLDTFGGVRPGQTVLVTAAAGGVGTMVVQLTRLFGARCIAAASSRAKLDLAVSLGAHAVVDYSSPGWPDEVRRMTGGRGVDLVLESIGGAISEECQRLLKPLGTIVLYGAASGAHTAVSRDCLRRLNARAIGFNFRLLVGQAPELAFSCVPELMELLTARRLRPVIHRRYSLDELAAAHLAMESRDRAGKILVRVRGG